MAAGEQILPPSSSQEVAGANGSLLYSEGVSGSNSAMKIKMLFLAPSLPFLALVALAETPSAQTNRYDGSTWALVDTAKVIAAAAEVNLANFPDCDDATVEQKSIRVYHPDGTAECQDETFTKVLTEKGKRNNRTISLSFILPYSKEEVIKLEVIHPNGELTPVDVSANSKETTR